MSYFELFTFLPFFVFCFGFKVTISCKLSSSTLKLLDPLLLSRSEKMAKLMHRITTCLIPLKWFSFAKRSVRGGVIIYLELSTEE